LRADEGRGKPRYRLG